MLGIRSVARSTLALIALSSQAALAQDAASYEKTSFYYAAHQDDWQLFMNPSAFVDTANPKTKTVFIHMTAGDAGLGQGRGGRKHPYYLARENGAEAAIRFMADTEAPPARRSAAHMLFNGHSVYRMRYRNAVGYFLRAPDGNPHGGGYVRTGYQSLKRLANGENNILAAVDGSAVYRGWSDLTATLRAIEDYERGKSPFVQINVADPDPKVNPGDHSDHLMTAKAALDSVSDLACARRVYYVDYASSHLPVNLSVQDRDLESAVFAVTSAGIRAFDHGSNWDWYDKAYIGRNYFRVQESNGTCGGDKLHSVSSDTEALRLVAHRKAR